MTGRAIAQTFVAFVLTGILTVIGSGLLLLSEGAALAEAFFVEGPRLVFGVFAIPGILWGALLLIGNLRNRRRASGWLYLTNQLSALAVAILAVVGWLVFALQGGWSLLLAGIALVVSAFFLAASIPSLLLTHFAFLRNRLASET